MRLIIAVDGPAAAGKGTLAKALAAALRLPHLDTGLLYRAVARQMILKGLDPAADSGEQTAQALQPEDLLRDDLPACAGNRSRRKFGSHTAPCTLRPASASARVCDSQRCGD
ncbi:Cytidylate kinase [Asaia bogorensis]|uniref:(d)CMP kinase n=1 Tax=Asaia bogorensis TaxID=91915 RepID=A0A060QIC5_9PROT|nr:Cytidylate kinase [Asaia bogorensis]